MRASEYTSYLVGCRFCPMCKPFGEVSNITQQEGHTTRIRAMLLWLVAQGHLQWEPRLVQLLYESTLDSGSQAWCVSHYPVPEYILAARADVVEAGLAPSPVMDLSIQPCADFDATLRSLEEKNAETVFYPGDALAARDPASSAAMMNLLSKLGQTVSLPAALLEAGGLAYCLGREDLAREQARLLQDAWGGAKTILVDGPLSYWMLTRVYPAWGLETKAEQVISSPAFLSSAAKGSQWTAPQALSPAYALASEFARLSEWGHDDFLQALRSISGLRLLEPRDGLQLADGSGVGGGLHLVAPELARRVSRARIEEAVQAGATVVVCDSPLDALHLREAANGSLRVLTVAEYILETMV